MLFFSFSIFSLFIGSLISFISLCGKLQFDSLSFDVEFVDKRFISDFTEEIILDEFKLISGFFFKFFIVNCTV